MLLKSINQNNDDYRNYLIWFLEKVFVQCHAFSSQTKTYRGTLHDVTAKILDCSLEVNELGLQSRYYIHFWTNVLGKGMNLLFSPAMGQIVSQLFFYKDDFSIK